MAKQIYRAHNAYLPSRLCTSIMQIVLHPDTTIEKHDKIIDFDGHYETKYAIHTRHRWNGSVQYDAITIEMKNDPTGKRLSPIYTDVYVKNLPVLSVDIRHPFIQKLTKTCDARIMENGRMKLMTVSEMSTAQILAMEYLDSITR